jgi:hypothetical protein
MIGIMIGKAEEDRYMPRLDGRIAFITGAGTGIGRATALLFAREGPESRSPKSTGRAATRPRIWPAPAQSQSAPM